MQRSTYTPEQKAEALRLLAEVGHAEAARRTGIPVGTISSWGSRAGIDSGAATAATRAALEARKATIAERKTALAEDLAKAAERMLADLYTPRLEQKVVTFAALGMTETVQIKHASTTDAQRKTTIEAVAKALETVQLLTGEATERIEQLTGRSVAEEALAVVDELAARRVS